jgi:hypothetical protein
MIQTFHQSFMTDYKGWLLTVIINFGIGTPKVDYRIVYQLKYATTTFCVQ